MCFKRDGKAGRQLGKPGKWGVGEGAAAAGYLPTPKLLNSGHQQWGGRGNVGAAARRSHGSTRRGRRSAGHGTRGHLKSQAAAFKGRPALGSLCGAAGWPRPARAARGRRLGHARPPVLPAAAAAAGTARGPRGGEGARSARPTGRGGASASASAAGPRPAGRPDAGPEPRRRPRAGGRARGAGKARRRRARSPGLGSRRARGPQPHKNVGGRKN